MERIFVDTGSSVDIMYLDCFQRMNMAIDVKPVWTSLFGFAGEAVRVYGKVQLPMVLGDGPWRQTGIINFMLIDSPSHYNVIMGRPSISEYAAIISTAHLMMKFPVEDEKQRVIGIGESYRDQRDARRCYVASVRSSGSLKRAGEQRSEEDKEIELERRKGKEPRVTEFEDGEIMSIELLPERPGHSVRLGQQLPGEIQEALTGILRKNVDLFAWKPEDMKGINPKIAVHRLNIKPDAKPVLQKRRLFGEQQNEIIEKEVAKLLKIGHIERIKFFSIVS